MKRGSALSMPWPEFATRLGLCPLRLVCGSLLLHFSVRRTTQQQPSHHSLTCGRSRSRTTGPHVRTIRVRCRDSNRGCRIHTR
eukprot:1736750-Prymnesium_polylepis.1